MKDLARRFSRIDAERDRSGRNVGFNGGALKEKNGDNREQK